jgi:hypothetical protein
LIVPMSRITWESDEKSRSVPPESRLDKSGLFFLYSNRFHYPYHLYKVTVFRYTIPG